MSTTPRYVAQFQHVEESNWEDTSYFKTSDIERAERFVVAMVGANKYVQAGRLYDQISEQVRLTVTKADISHVVECFDDNSLRAYFTNTEEASAYANELISNGHQVQLLPYNPETR